MSNFIVGLTGGIGSGKSTVTNMFIELGVDVIDADIIAREVVLPESIALKAIETKFGNEIINNDGELNRALLRTRVFTCPDNKQWLNDLLHPIIREEIIKQTKAAITNYCLLVAPLLIENSLTSFVNRVLVIDVSEHNQLERTLARDNSSKDEIKAIIASQTTRVNRISFADDIIDNNEKPLDFTFNQVKKLHANYMKISN
jgi:dephospho-CoA kinase